MADRPDGPKPFQEYPQMVYHLDGSRKIVRNREQQRALGPSWFKRPDEASATFDSLSPVEQLELLLRANNPTGIDDIYKRQFLLAQGREK